MNDGELIRKLRELITPQPGEGVREKALHRARIALVNPGDEVPAAGVSRGWLWLVARSAACVAVAAISALLFVRSHHAGGGEADAKLLKEMEVLFPGQIDSVVTRGGQVDLNLADAPDANSSQPLAVELRRDDQTIRVLTFSGRKVCLNLGGREECFETLVTGEGQVILSGDHFLWSTEDPKAVDGFSVHAATL